MFCTCFQVHGAQPAANVPLFSPASLSATNEMVAPPEMQWHPVVNSEELGRARWGSAEASMVPELSNFHGDYRNNKRLRTSLWS